MRRPSIPFEAIGLHTRLRRAALCVTLARQETTTMSNDPKDPKDEELIPANELPDNFEDDDDLEEELDEEDDD